MIHKNAPNSTHLLPVGIKIDANALDDLVTTLQYAHNVAEWLPPVLIFILSRTFRDTIEFEAEGFDLLLPAAKGDHKVTLTGKLDDTGVRAQQRC
jgi:hypothetical protein